MNQNKKEVDGFDGFFPINYYIPTKIQQREESRKIESNIINTKKPVHPVKCRWCGCEFDTLDTLIAHMNSESKYSIELWEKVNRRKLPLPYYRIGVT